MIFATEVGLKNTNLSG